MDLLNSPEYKDAIFDLFTRKTNPVALALMLRTDLICPDVAFDTMKRSGYSEAEIDAFWRTRGDFADIEVLKKHPEPPPEKHFNRGPITGALPEEVYDPRLKWKGCCG